MKTEGLPEALPKIGWDWKIQYILLGYGNLDNENFNRVEFDAFKLEWLNRFKIIAIYL
jgi:hypothetical protein